jgi:hypothetical protein
VSQRKVYEWVETFKSGMTSESDGTSGYPQKIKLRECPPCRKKNLFNLILGYEASYFGTLSTKMTNCPTV